jgi:hypothetical protein
VIDRDRQRRADERRRREQHPGARCTQLP